MNFDKEVSHRIAIARILMILGIVLLHLPPYEPLSEVGGDAFSYVKAFFAHGVFRASVPVLTAISGYLIIKSHLAERPVVLFKRKTRSVLLPLVIWNMPLALVVFLAQKYGFLSHDFSVQLHPFGVTSWLDALTGIYTQPVNYPLNFLRDLFVISLLSPILVFLLRISTVLTVLVICAVCYWDLDGMLVLRNSMLISFTLGAIVAWGNYSLKALDKLAIPLLVLFILFCISIVIFRIENTEWLRLIAPVLIWPALGLILHCSAGRFMISAARYSFVIFLTHAPLILVLWFIWSKPESGWSYIFYWLTAIPFVYFASIVFYNLMRKYFPATKAFILGGR